MNVEYNGRFKCATCGHDSYFEPNHDESYILCLYCLTEYQGGTKELSRLNTQRLNNQKINVDTEIKSDTVKDLFKITKLN